MTAEQPRVDARLVQLTVNDGIAVATMNRPDVLNAVDDAMRAELTAVLEQVGQDDSIRALILTGAGRGFSAGGDIPPELARLRHSIDNIDAALVYLLAERFKATKQVGVLKAHRGLPPSDPGREVRQVARLRELAHQADLDPVFAEKFLAFIVEEVIRHHEAIAQDGGREPAGGGPTV